MARYNYGYIDELRVKRKRRKVRVAFLVIYSSIAFVVFMTYALFFSGWFSIKEIQVSGYNEISEPEIRNLIGDYLSKKYLFGYIKPFSNILFASSETIKDSLRENFPIIKSVDIDKGLFNKNLTVEINEKEAVGIWCKNESDKCFYFDREGVMFKPALRFSGEIFLTIEDGRGRGFNLADSFDDRELFEKIGLTRGILDELKFIGYSNFFLPQGSFEFWIKTKEGWYVYLDKENDVPIQLVALKKFLEEKIPVSRRQSLQYIDLRVNNRIYYK